MPKLSEMVAAQLRRQVVSGALKAGDPLPPETQLMQHFGISRTTLREALRILESESILTIRRGSRGGARVMEPDPKVAARHAGLLLQHRGVLLADVYQARTLIETISVGHLARWATPADLAKLDLELQCADTVISEPRSFALRGAAFHRLIADLAGNSTVAFSLGMLCDIIESHHWSYRANRTPPVDAMAAAIEHRAHCKLVALIAVKDIVGATSFWRNHLSDARDGPIDDPARTVVGVLF